VLQACDGSRLTEETRARVQEMMMEDLLTLNGQMMIENIEEEIRSCAGPRPRKAHHQEGPPTVLPLADKEGRL
jgi:hypothetical protein